VGGAPMRSAPVGDDGPVHAHADAVVQIEEEDVLVDLEVRHRVPAGNLLEGVVDRLVERRIQAADRDAEDLVHAVLAGNLLLHDLRRGGEVLGAHQRELADPLRATGDGRDRQEDREPSHREPSAVCSIFIASPFTRMQLRVYRITVNGSTYMATLVRAFASGTCSSARSVASWMFGVRLPSGMNSARCTQSDPSTPRRRVVPTTGTFLPVATVRSPIRSEHPVPRTPVSAMSAKSLREHLKGRPPSSGPWRGPDLR